MPPSPSPKADAPRELPERFADSVSVHFSADDGVRLDGRVYGNPRAPRALVLAHMGESGNDQSDWAGFAARTAGKGLRVLTLNRRGVCPGGLWGCSGGSDVYAEHWRDVVGAVAYLREHGATRIAVGGASIGAMAALEATLRHPQAIKGVVWVAGLDAASGYSFERKEVASLQSPLLLVSASRDPYLADASARSLNRWARDSTLVLIPSDLHGTDLLEGSARERSSLAGAIRKFVRVTLR